MRRRVALLALSGLMLGGCTKIQARDHIREGNALYKDGQFEQAIEAYGQSLELEPDGVTVLWNRACAAESIVLQLKDSELKPEQREARKKYADIALADFQKWLDNLPAPNEEDEQQVHDHRLAILKADERCDDLVAYWLEKHRSNPQDEGLYTVIARTYEETCGQREKADEWYVKRTQDFPESSKSWYALAVREFDPLFPDAESGLAYNDSLSAEQRRARAEKVIGFLNNATKHDPKYRDPYVWRAMAYTQMQFSRVYDETSTAPEDKLQAILAREDSMMAWKESKAVCDIDEIPDCPIQAEFEELAAEPGKFANQRIFVNAKIIGETVKELSGAPDFKYSFEITSTKQPAEPKKGEEAVEPPRIKVEYTFLKPVAPEGEPAPDISGHVDEVAKAWKGTRKEFLTGTIDAGGTLFKAAEQPPVACCPLPPLTDEERAADATLKQELLAAIEAEKAAEAAKANKKKKKKRKR
jgi:tetratricopeptide (TPR) repeat protein